MNRTAWMRALRATAKYALRVGIVVATVAVLSIGMYAIAAYCPLRIGVDLTDERQTVAGFGASSAWTFQRMGRDATEQVKRDSVEMLYGQSGLALNIYRYNIGGGSADAALDAREPYNQAWFDADRRAESFFVAERYGQMSDFSDPNNYDFETRDQGALEMFARSLATGNVEQVVFFANSPHYLMTQSGLCTGAQVQQNNLRPECYEAFADYLLISVQGIYDRYLAHLPVAPQVSISPINEPQWDWGGPDATQEGCHYDPQELARFADVFMTRLQAWNRAHGTTFEGDLFESGNYKFYSGRDDVRDYLQALESYDWFRSLRSVSVHAYGAEDSVGHRRKFADYLRKRYPEKKVSVTEFCEMEEGRFDTMRSGLFLGKVINRDLSIVQATDWSWWLAVSSGDYNDGLVYWDTDAAGNQKLSVLKRYYVMGHFSKFLDRGDVALGATCSDLTGWAGLDYSAYRKADGSVVLIVLNDGCAKSLRVGGLDAYATAQYTVTDPTCNWQTSESAWQGRLKLPAHSAVTVVLSP